MTSQDLSLRITLSKKKLEDKVAYHYLSQTPQKWEIFVLGMAFYIRICTDPFIYLIKKNWKFWMSFYFYLFIFFYSLYKIRVAMKKKIKIECDWSVHANKESVLWICNWWLSIISIHSYHMVNKCLQKSLNQICHALLMLLNLDLLPFAC